MQAAVRKGLRGNLRGETHCFQKKLQLIRTGSERTGGILSSGLNFVSGWSRHAKTNKLGPPRLILPGNREEGPVVMALCESLTALVQRAPATHQTH